jgi:hypothetical protein
MKARTTIRLDSIEQAHRALDALPEHCPEELTKTQAVERLIAPIRAARSKGYSLAAIGKVLSDCGIPITTGALRAYVSEAAAGARGKRKPKAKRPARAANATQSGAAKRGVDASLGQPTPRAARPGGTGVTGTIDLDWDPAARSEKPTASPAGASRPGFYARPETKDL